MQTSGASLFGRTYAATAVLSIRCVVAIDPEIKSLEDSEVLAPGQAPMLVTKNCVLGFH